MSGRARPRLIVERRARAFERHFPDALDGDVEGIHQARVASRRLREVLPLLASAPGARALPDLRRDVRNVTRLLGSVRELDVALEHLTGLAERSPEFAGAILAVRSFTQAQRDEAFAAARHHLSAADAQRVRHRVADLAAGLTDPDAERDCARLVADRLAARRLALSASAQAAGSVYAAGPLHDLRIRLKKHRYALEIALELLRSRSTLALKRSKQLQDLLGELHDLAVLAARVEDYRTTAPRRPLSTILKRLSGLLDTQLRTLHLDYLERREQVALILDRSESAVRAVRREGGHAAPARRREGGGAATRSHP